MEDDICAVESGGSSIVRFKSLFSHDAKYLMCPCGNVVKVYSVNTGECFQRLIGHSKLVTGIAHHPKIKLQILSCSLDNTIKLWDYEDGVALASYDISQPLKGIFTHRSYPDTVLIVKQLKGTSELHKFELPTTSASEDVLRTTHVAKLTVDLFDKYIALSESFVIVASTKQFSVYLNPSDINSHNMVKHTMNEEEPITCVACHPTEEICATGHGKGRIRIWYNINNAKKLFCHVRHWHSLSVCTLAFSAHGSMMLSGGHESVFVQWRQDECDFFPRLGSVLTGITVSEDGMLYSVSLQDNSVLVFSNTFKVKQSIEGFAAANSEFPCGLQYDPATTACVTNGKPGHLLFYFCPSDNQLYNLDIIRQNFISSSDLENPLSQTKITYVAFTQSEGDFYMATLEFNDISARDQKLKFWIFDETEQSWMLETTVTSPHNNKDVTSLCLHPTEALCITSSRDCSAKVWAKSERGWECDCVVTYRGFKCFHAAFSQDGSVLALVFGQTLLLAKLPDVNNLTLFTSFSMPIRSIHFGRDACSHYLVITTMDQVQCWDVRSGDITWYSDVGEIKFVVQDQFSESMALFTNHNEVFVFRPCSSTPLLSYEVDDVVAACFVPHPQDGILWMKQSSLYMVSKNAVVKKFTLRCKAEEERSLKHRVGMDGSLNVPMSSLLAMKIGKLTEDVVPESLRHSTVEAAMKQIALTPVHVLPPMSTLCEQFISSLLFETDVQ